MKPNAYGDDPEKSVIPDTEKGFTRESPINYRTEKADKEGIYTFLAIISHRGCRKLMGFILSHLQRWGGFGCLLAVEFGFKRLS